MNRGRAVLVVVALLVVAVTIDVQANYGHVVDNYVSAFQGFSPNYNVWPIVERRGGIDRPAAGVEQILIRLNTGSVRVVGGAGQTVRGTHQVQIWGKTEAQAEAYFEKVEVQVSEAEGMLVIEFVEPEFRPLPVSWVHCHLDLVVPAAANVQIDSYAPVQVQDVDGDVEISCAGDVWVWDVKGSLAMTHRGNWGADVDLRRIGGAVAYDGIAGTVEIDTTGGDLTLDLKGGTSCKVNGVAGDSDIAFRHTRSVELIDPAGDVKVHGERGRLTIDGLRGALDLAGRRTNARVIVAEGPGFDVAVDTRVTATTLLSDFPLETTEDGFVRGRIGAGGHPIQVDLSWGTFELMDSGRRGTVIVPLPPQQMPHLGPGQAPRRVPR